MSVRAHTFAFFVRYMLTKILPGKAEALVPITPCFSLFYPLHESFLCPMELVQQPIPKCGYAHTVAEGQGINTSGSNY